MRILYRWIVLTMIAVSVVTSAAIVIPRHFMPDSTVQFWMIDGYGAYHYYYDFRTESLYLEEQWHPNAQIAPDGEQAVVLKRGIRTVYIDTVRAGGERESLGEFPVDIIDLNIQWSPDSSTIYMTGHSENGITLYSFEIATQELKAIIEYEDLAIEADWLEASYAVSDNLLVLTTNYFLYADGLPSPNTIYQFYDLETGEGWRIDDKTLIPVNGWDKYLSYENVYDHYGNVTGEFELEIVSTVDNSRHEIALPSEGRVLNIFDLGYKNLYLLITSEPDESYILDLETEKVTSLDVGTVLVPWWSLPQNGRYTYVLDGQMTMSETRPIYRLDLESYEITEGADIERIQEIMEDYPQALVVSPDNRSLVLLNSSFDRYNNPEWHHVIQMISLETGEMLHRFDVPDNFLAPQSENFGKVLQWYEP